MEQDIIGKKAKVIALMDGKKFFYTAQNIIDITKHHIYFYDKFGSLIGIRKENVIQITLID